MPRRVPLEIKIDITFSGLPFNSGKSRSAISALGAAICNFKKNEDCPIGQFAICNFITESSSIFKMNNHFIEHKVLRQIRCCHIFFVSILEDPMFVSAKTP